MSYLYRTLTQRKEDTEKTVLEAVDLGAELDELDVGETIREVFENATKIESASSPQENRPARD